MNRATKRLLAKQEAQSERERARTAPLARGDRGKRNGGRRAQAGGEKREGRIKRLLSFLREVRAELKKVAWPSRNEVLTYTGVVLLSVTTITMIVFVLDFAFGHAVLRVFKG